MRLTVTADDLGYSAARNRGIFEACTRGVVTRASLLVTGAAAAAAVAQARELDVPLGLHLNLTEGRPVLPPAEVPSLVRGDGSGCFRGKLGFFAAAAGGEIDEEDVLRETRAQMTSFAALAAAVGAPPQPNHLDGHNHIQAAPVVARALCRLDLPQPELRLPQPLAAAAGGDKMQSQMDALSPFLQRVVRLTMDSARPVLRSHDTAPPLASDVLLGLDLMGAALTREALLVAIDHCISAGVEHAELMVHPGYASAEGGLNGESADDFAASTDREHELAVLCDPDLACALRQRGVALAARRGG